MSKVKDPSISLTPDGRMTLKDAAHFIGCCCTTLRKNMALGIAPAHFKVVGKIFFYKQDIENWIEMQRLAPSFTKSRISIQRKKEALDEA